MSAYSRITPPLTRESLPSNSGPRSASNLPPAGFGTIVRNCAGLVRRVCVCQDRKADLYPEHLMRECQDAGAGSRTLPLSPAWEKLIPLAYRHTGPAAI